jgi:hypothetical protein
MSMPCHAPLRPPVARACYTSMLRSCIAIVVLLLASADVFDGNFQPTLSRYAAPALCCCLNRTPIVASSHLTSLAAISNPNTARLSSLSAATSLISSALRSHLHAHDRVTFPQIRRLHRPQGLPIERRRPARRVRFARVALVIRAQLTPHVRAVITLSAHLAPFLTATPPISTASTVFSALACQCLPSR